MSVESGAQFGVYKIVGPLGAGGMGEVYRAADTKLDRQVALKVLPEAMGQDPERYCQMLGMSFLVGDAFG
jgi:serine/threonine protein kinase